MSIQFVQTHLAPCDGKIHFVFTCQFMQIEIFLIDKKVHKPTWGLGNQCLVHNHYILNSANDHFKSIYEATKTIAALKIGRAHV